MDKSRLKSYAPKARLDFIRAISARAAELGISASGATPAQLRGDVLLIDGREWPAVVASQRKALLARIRRQGYAQTMEEIAYTWFNRLAALRYMELHDYLGHGWRVLSSRDGGQPEILRHAAELPLPGLSAARIRELQLAGNRDNELYKLLLVAQCNELSRVMPFLFERIHDDTELLLPENLLRTDSIVSGLVGQLPEADWQQIEVIGWLYQFYIADEKKRVDDKVKAGKVVESNEIPAKTQLFTPNWIVQYLVQNSVGRLWLMAHPQSPLASQWPYYIQPAEQTAEVQAQLDALIQTRIREDGATLNPETLTVLDPACGSGHILVVAYEVLKAIYLERGYQPRSIPRLILEKNLFGLDIDDRAAQLAGFALLMKARADDRRLFNDPPRVNVLSLQESKGLDAGELATHLAPYSPPGANWVESDWRRSLISLLDTFEHAKTFGSLIRVPAALNAQLPAMTAALQPALESDDLYVQQAARVVLPLVWQAVVLGMQFDAVVANPPYMGSRGMNPSLKNYARLMFPDSKADLFAMFMECGFSWGNKFGFISMVTMQSWMFLSSYDLMRKKLLESCTISTMAHFGAKAFAENSGEIVQTTAFVLQAQRVVGFRPVFFRLVQGSEAEKETALRGKRNRFDAIIQDDLSRVPESPIAYWASANSVKAFSSKKIGDLAETRLGMATADNNRFLRFWFEVDFRKIGLGVKSREEAIVSGKRWFQYQKGGEYRKWFGNLDIFVNWQNDGFEIQNFVDEETGRVRSHNYNLDFIFKEGITWNALSSGNTSARLSRASLFDNAGSSLFAEDRSFAAMCLAFLNSVVVVELVKIISPTLNYQPGDIAKLPVRFSPVSSMVVCRNVDLAISIAEDDWRDVETSWGFSRFPIFSRLGEADLLMHSWSSWLQVTESRIQKMKILEEDNNRILVQAYGMQGELSPEVPESQITLARADREKDCQRLISYAIGCMMGRYSLDEPGLIYAHAGNVGFDPTRYEKKFPADADGILPITAERWFEDDAANRVREFLRAVWGADTLEENLAWLAESLGQKGNETAEESIRRYLADKFYKDHLQTYKKRPIYWLFSSGKLGAFQALVYLHRYHEGTLARMRAEYLLPLLGKYAARLDMLDKDLAHAASAAARSKLQKNIEALRKEHRELLAYDEKLRHYADLRITLDLDDGVKVNYGKFGDLLDSVKIVTGGTADD